VTIDEARRRIAELAHLNAFISVSGETAEGTVVAVKDLVDVRGMITTAGGVLLPNTSADADAPVIKRIREHGAVVVGKTNLHEFAYGVTSINPHYGNVLNPHDPSRVAGGSSGGSAVAVATGMCDWAIGTDTGGSIRIPAALCGVVGFKPQLGSIPMEGVIPLSRSLDTLGPIGPDVATVTRAFYEMSGQAPEPPAPGWKPRLGVPAGWVTGLDPDVQKAWRFASEGIPEVEFVDRMPLFRNGLTILMVEAYAYHAKRFKEHPDRFGADVAEHLRQGRKISPRDYGQAIGTAPLLREAARRAMRDLDALVLPTTAIVAPPVTAGTEAREPLARYTRPFNMSGQPVVSIPAPVRTGLPVGVQVVGRTNAIALAAAAWLEKRWTAAR
jgi:Asp-tRNA(Asn)/Glu-tRNA(Gln) amidotransferase A subunit family amidase